MVKLPKELLPLSVPLTECVVVLSLNNIDDVGCATIVPLLVRFSQICITAFGPSVKVAPGSMVRFLTFTVPMAAVTVG